MEVIQAVSLEANNRIIQHKALEPHLVDSSAANKLLLEQVEVYSVARAQAARHQEVVSSAITLLSNSHSSSRQAAFSEGQAKQAPAFSAPPLAIKEAEACLARLMLRPHSQVVEDSLAVSPRVLHQAVVVSSEEMLNNQQQVVDSSHKIMQHLKIKEASLGILVLRQVDNSIKLMQMPAVASSVTMLASKTNHLLLSPHSRIHRLEEASLELQEEAGCSVIITITSKPIKAGSSAQVQALMLLLLRLVADSSELVLLNRVKEAYSALVVHNNHNKVA